MHKTIQLFCVYFNGLRERLWHFGGISSPLWLSALHHWEDSWSEGMTWSWFCHKAEMTNNNSIQPSWLCCSSARSMQGCLLYIDLSCHLVGIFSNSRDTGTIVVYLHLTGCGGVDPGRHCAGSPCPSRCSPSAHESPLDCPKPGTLPLCTHHTHTVWHTYTGL